MIVLARQIISSLKDAARGTELRLRGVEEACKASVVT